MIYIRITKQVRVEFRSVSSLFKIKFLQETETIINVISVAHQGRIIFPR